MLISARYGYLQAVKNTYADVKLACEDTQGNLTINKTDYLCFTQEQFKNNVRNLKHQGVMEYLRHLDEAEKIPPYYSPNSAPSPGT